MSIQSNESANNAEKPAGNSEDPQGIFEIHGTFVGSIRPLKAVNGLPVSDELPPDDLRGLGLMQWNLSQEFRANPFSVFELYIAIMGSVWGAYLLLPLNTFSRQGNLWYPLRTLFQSGPGSLWYDYGAENMVGLILLLVHSLHLWALYHRREGDFLRRLTISAMFAGWLTLAFLFGVADISVPSWLLMGIGAAFLFISLRAVFRRAAVRK